MVKFVTVKFLSTHPSSAGDYVYQDDIGVKPFDVVLAPTRYGWGLAVVDAVEVPEPSFVTKKLAEKLESKVLDKELNVERAKAIKKALDKKLKKLDEVERYKMYVDKDPEIKELVERLEALTKN